ncbi:MAG: DNA topoisomerase VI subunit B [Thermoprotei archaeon]|jgi:DNA topoisomerase-6 subunit B|uniref:Type 2 DNA topoisomerase 6 subunit B n=1 Tax=Fervidicoccus fontis TaxID=683846 RepID=A0A7J3SK61_9CREN|nr:DNA topoisomerase VI subunit B [Thermoprotei archaeon]
MAESTAESFRQMSPAEFFYRNKEIAGFTSASRAMYQTVREFFENSLDATEVYGILPRITLRISKEDPNNPSYFTVTVEDNGIGIPSTIIPDAFGRVLFSSKYKLKQTRGMYGLGAKMAILYGQQNTGKPFEIYSSTMNSKRVYFYKLMIKMDKNEPLVLEEGEWPKSSKWHGTIVKLTLEGEWSKRTRDYISVYLKRTAIIAPYADIIFISPSTEAEGQDQEVTVYRRVTNKLPVPPKETKPHPIGVDLEMLKLMISERPSASTKEFLIKGFQRVGEKKAEEILKKANIEPGKKVSSLTNIELERLYKAMKETKFIAPSAESLSPIGEELIKIGLKEVLQAEFVDAITRKPKSYGGHPFIVEAGIAYGGKLLENLDEIAKDSIKGQQGPFVALLRYANKIPLLFDEKADVIWSIVNSDEFSWKTTYKLDPTDVVAVLVHVASTKVPYKGVGKESIAPVEEIRKEVEAAVQELARRLRVYLTKKRKKQEAQEKFRTFMKYIPEIAQNLAYFVSNGKKHPSEVSRELEKALIEMAKKKIKTFIEQPEEAISIATVHSSMEKYAEQTIGIDNEEGEGEDEA